MAKNLSYLSHHSQKIRNPKPRIFFHCRLAESFEGLNNSLPKLAEESCSH